MPLLDTLDPEPKVVLVGGTARVDPAEWPEGGFFIFVEAGDDMNRNADTAKLEGDAWPEYSGTNYQDPRRRTSLIGHPGVMTVVEMKHKCGNVRQGDYKTTN